MATSAVSSAASTPSPAPPAPPAPRPASRRLFVAACPPPDQRAALAAWARGCTWPAGAKVVAPARWHATLLFIGAVAETQLDMLDALLDAAARGAPAPELVFDRVQRWAQGVVVLAPSPTPHGPGTPPGLDAWQAALADRLREAALPCDRRPLRLHLTLAREAAGAALPLDAPTLRWRLDEFALVQSGTLAAGSSAPGAGAYRTLARYAFGRGRCG